MFCALPQRRALGYTKSAEYTLKRGVTMTCEELMRDVRKGTAHSIYVLHGEDAAEVRRSGQQLAGLLVSEEQAAAGQMLKVSGKWDMDEFRFWLQEIPFLGGQKWLWWHGCPWLGEAGAEEIAAAAEMVAPWPEYAGLLLTATKLDKRTRFYKALVQAGGVEAACAMLRPWEAEAWFSQYLQKAGRTLERDASAWLASLFSSSQQLAPGWLEQEAEKVLLYTQGRKRISLTDVQTMLAATPEASSFALLDAIAAGQCARALSLLEEACRSSNGAFMLIPLLARQLRLQLQSLEVQGGKQELAKELKVHPYVAEKLLRQRGDVSPGLLRYLLQELARLEGGIKSGTRLLQGELEKLVILWCEKGRQKK